LRGRRSDLAILKTIGFTPRQLTASVVLASFLVAVIGSALPAREVVRTSASETLRAD
jgi:ABC-type lipoprotein release transport system permease subunit